MTIATSFLIMAMGSANATTMIPLTMDQLVDASDHVVRGKVVEVWAEPDRDNGFVWTKAQVEISSVLKGDLNLELAVLEQPGGTWGSIESSAEGAARFSVGEEGYFFIEELKSGKMVTTGMHQGKFNIQMDPHSRKNIALRFHLSPRNTFDHRFIPLPAEPSKRVTVDRFEAQIRARVEKGWDGKAIPGASTDKLRRINRIQPQVTK